MANQIGEADVYVRKSKILIVAIAIKGVGPSPSGSIYGSRTFDPETFSALLKEENEDGTLGSLLRTALSLSRIDHEPESYWHRPALFNERLATLFELKTSNRLYPGMTTASCQLYAGKVELSPLRSKRGGVFEGFTGALVRGHEDVEIPADASDEAYGAALRLCLSRCVFA